MVMAVVLDVQSTEMTPSGLMRSLLYVFKTTEVGEVNVLYSCSLEETVITKGHVTNGQH